MTIDTREAKALVNVIESLLDSLDQNFDSLPTEIDQKVKDAKLTLLNVDTKNERQRPFSRIFG
jgi:prefoldin subunit 5